MVQNGTWEWLLEGFKLDLETQVKNNTVEYYYGRIRSFVRWATGEGQLTDPRLVGKRDIQAFFHHLTHTPDVVVANNGTRRKFRRGDNYAWHYYRCLKRFFTWMVEEEHFLEQSPMDGIRMKAPKDPPVEPWRPEHINLMFDVIKHSWRTATTERQRMLAARNEAVLSFFLESFVRLEELTSLEVADVYLEKKRALVKKGKMGKGRWVGFGPQTKKALWRYLGLRSSLADHGALWITEEGRPLTKHGIQEIFRRLKRDAGLQHVRGSVHKLRHTGATISLKHTHDMKGLRLLLGHSTLAMTERYTQFIEVEDALKAYDQNGPLDWIAG
ncbi:MAG: tyrosine-type recombinase/integrase [Dehalococcoidia bacterium]|nr:tyrosine-type recombinase/integrase [Dehalococcoidia bacterium]